MSRPRKPLDISAALLRARENSGPPVPTPNVSVTRAWIVAALWTFGYAAIAAAAPRWLPVSPSPIQQRHNQDVILAANKDGADRDRSLPRSTDTASRRDRSDSGSPRVQSERPPVERAHSRKDPDRSDNKSAKPAATDESSAVRQGKERSRNRKKADTESGERSPAAKGHRGERERAKADVDLLAADAKQAEIELKLRAAELAQAEERYRAGQINKKELERARRAYEFAKARAESARQFLTAAQARLIDLRKAGDP